MAEIRQFFNTERDGDKIIFTNSIIKEMSIQEAIKERKQLENEVTRMVQEEAKLTKAMEDLEEEKALGKLIETRGKITELAKKWDIILEKDIEELKAKIKHRIREEIISTGYMRIKDKTEKINKKNQILAPICTEFSLDRGDKIMREVADEFDKI